MNYEMMGMGANALEFKDVAVVLKEVVCLPKDLVEKIGNMTTQQNQMYKEWGDECLKQLNSPECN